jgi:hypothetical protein
MDDSELLRWARPAPDSVATVRAAIRRRWRWAALAPVVLAVLGAVFGSRASWGDVATWVVAITTLLAFVAAAFAGLVAYELLRTELSRDVNAARDRVERDAIERRGQASALAAWYSTWQSENTFYPMRGGEPVRWPRSSHSGAVIRNASGLPVYNVRVSFCVPVDPSGGLTWRQGERYSSPNLTHVMPPGDTHIPLPDDVWAREEAEGTEPEWLVAVEFTDANGHRWLRDPHGRLSPAGQLADQD